MVATGVGAPSGDEGGSAAVEERPNAIAGAVALLGPGLADGVIDDEDEANLQSAPCPVGQEAAAEDDGHDGEDATVADDVTPEPAPAIDTADESGAAGRADEGTPAAETIEVEGQPASDTAPSDDTPSDSSGEAEAAAEDALSRPPILNVGEGELVPKERYAGRVDRDKFASCWFGTYGDADQSVVKARLKEQGQHVAPLDEHGAHLGDPVHLSIAEESDVPIVYRVHRGLSDAEKREFVLSQQDGDRLRTPKQRRQLKHTRVLALLDIRAGSDKRLTFAEIGRRVGYTEARVRQIHRKHQEPRDRNISDPESRETPAAPSKSASRAKQAKEKKVAAGTTEPMSAAPQPARQVAGFDPAQVAIERLGLPPVDAEILMEKSKEAGARRFKDLLAGHSGGNREELRLTLTSIVEFESARATALSYLEGLLTSGQEGAA